MEKFDIPDRKYYVRLKIQEWTDPARITRSIEEKGCKPFFVTRLKLFLHISDMLYAQ